MLKKTLTYEDFNSQIVTEDFYFNLTKAELIELEMSEKDGFSEKLKTIVETKDGKDLIKNFKEMVLLAYGVKSEDGRRFIKNDQVREEFSQTAAYSDLFYQLATDANFAAEFIKGLIPSELVGSLDNLNNTVNQNVFVEASIDEIPSFTSSDGDLSSMSKEDLMALVQKNTTQ